jgi:hypothetical protein
VAPARSTPSLLNRRSFLSLASAFSLTMRWPGIASADELKSTARTVPRDLPIAEAPPSSAEWLDRAVTLQPWGATEYKALTALPPLPAQLKKEFGFNAIIVLPWEAHNALTDAALPLTDPATRLTEAQFRAGLSSYRREGYKLILYSSVMHCGHAPVWQSGQLGREHPDWLQRDATGQTIGAFGQAWLCPSSPARAYTLDYTLNLVRNYSPDGIMLDNNGFGHTTKGFACYCEHCQRAFKKYVVARCGALWVRRELLTNPDQLRIPTEKGPLLALWLCWRSRVWAETDELFRSRLRNLRPQIAFFVNIQYDQNPDPQAGRLQFSHEDLVFSETHESDSWYISQKLVFGQALTQDRRPLWNYLATFRDSNPLRLRSPEEVSLMVSTSLAHNALPWINYPGLDSVQDQSSRKEIARHVSWFASHPELFAGKLSSSVGTVVSLLTRDVFQAIKSCNKQGVTGCSASEDTPVLMSKHVGLLLRAGMPVIALREVDLSQAKLKGFRILTLPAARILDRGQAETLAAWVRAGGTLIAAPDSGEYDELGRKQAGSTLWQALGLAEAPSESRRVGSGTLQVRPADRFDEAVLASVATAKLAFSVPQGTEVVCREAGHRCLLHIVQHEQTTKAPLLTLPAWLQARNGVCQWFSPDWSQPREIAFHAGMPLDVSGLPTYSIVALDR